MTTTTEAQPRWVETVVAAAAAVVVAMMIHVLSNDVTWQKVLTFALAATLVAAASFVALRSSRIIVALLAAAAAVYASRSFLSLGLINGLDVGLLMLEDVLAPFAATWIATFVLASAVIIAAEARSKIWLFILLGVITALTIPVRFPDLV